MDFFTHQENAKRLSRRLVLLFALAVLCIVASIATLASVLMVGFDTEPQPINQSYPAWLPIWLGMAALTLVVIGLCAAIRSWQLRAGGARIAEQLGGTRVAPDTSDTALRRLYNVVEEIAIASGSPMPAVYVLEQEPGINAFAAGYSASDAAIAVTRGCLEQLSRSELQGVIAHEFSHIQHGDMRINVRLMGLLFGILAIAILGRTLLRTSALRGRGRSKDTTAMLVIGAVVMLLGYIGVFFGRLIKASVSRQREYLADASAVQFTRDAQAISGALKKIARLDAGSRLKVDGEEVAHMLFGDGVGYSRWFATHPPLLQRIQRIEPSFTADDLQRLEPAATVSAAQATDAPDGATPLLDALPAPLLAAAHNQQQAMALVLALLAHTARSDTDQQLAALADATGVPADEVRSLLDQCDTLEVEQHLPLLHLAMPTLKSFDQTQQNALLAASELLTEKTENVSLLEYGLANTLRTLLSEAQSPADTRDAGSQTLHAQRSAVLPLLAALAHLGHADASAAAAAFSAGATTAFPHENAAYQAPGDWMTALDQALGDLDQLSPAGKRGLLQAMQATVAHDGHRSAAEAEALRVICARLHIPIPHPGAETA